jgi:addiction module HigA family antidote
MPIHNPLHPGKIIEEILVEGAGISISSAAKLLGVDRSTLSRLINGRARISPEMALRLSKLLPNTDMVLWMNLQRDYDIHVAMRKEGRIKVKPLKAA